MVPDTVRDTEIYKMPFCTWPLKKRFYLFIFREREREREREGEKHQCVIAPYMPPTGHLAYNLGMCSNWELNQRPFTSLLDAQCTEPQQLGPALMNLKP